MNETPVEKRIKQELDSLRQYLQADGGDVEFVSFNSVTGIAHVRLTGACHSCPMSLMTLRGGIERMLKHAISEIVRVEQAQ